MNSQNESSSTTVIDFNEKIETPAGVLPLWTIGAHHGEPNTTFFIDTNIQDNTNVIFAINKADQSVYVFPEALCGGIVNTIDHKTGEDFDYFETSDARVETAIRSIIDTGKFETSSDSIFGKDGKRCFVLATTGDVGMYTMEILQEDGGINMLTNSQKKGLTVFADYPPPAPKLALEQDNGLKDANQIKGAQPEKKQNQHQSYDSGVPF